MRMRWMMFRGRLWDILVFDVAFGLLGTSRGGSGWLNESRRVQSELEAAESTQ